MEIKNFFLYANIRQCNEIFRLKLHNRNMTRNQINITLLCYVNSYLILPYNYLVHTK